MKDKLLRQTKREYSPNLRLVALAVEGVFFLGIFPFALIALGSALDQRLGWMPILYGPINLVLGGLFIVSFWLLAAWSIYAQFTLGRGTPVPVMATQKLIVRPPYSYCRNPMALGAIGMYLGVAILFGSVGAVVLVMLGAGLLLAYIKRFEEKEMEIRFGQEYLEYRERTPFLVPRL